MPSLSSPGLTLFLLLQLPILEVATDALVMSLVVTLVVELVAASAGDLPETAMGRGQVAE